MIPWNEPFERFATLFEEAKRVVSPDPNGMQLATANAEGHPTIRTVLMKGFDERGWVFFGNKGSRKGRDLAAQPHAAINFAWLPMHAQVRIEGVVSSVSDAEADEYFATRPRASQLGAWASLQSEELGARAELERRLEEVSATYEGKTVPRPPRWGGWRLAPEHIEFWRAHPNRLHWREVYTRLDARTWSKGFLYP